MSTCRFSSPPSNLSLYLVTRRGCGKKVHFFWSGSVAVLFPTLPGSKWLKIKPQTAVRFGFDLRYTLGLKIVDP